MSVNAKVKDIIVDQLSVDPEKVKFESKFIEDAKSYTWLNSAQLHVKTYLRLLND